MVVGGVWAVTPFCGAATGGRGCGCGGGGGCAGGEAAALFKPFLSSIASCFSTPAGGGTYDHGRKIINPDAPLSTKKKKKHNK